MGKENTDNRTESEIKKDKLHKNLLIIFTAIGIVSFTLGAMVNYHALKNISSGAKS
jgi:hypothetical protein